MDPCGVGRARAFFTPAAYGPRPVDLSRSRYPPDFVAPAAAQPQFDPLAPMPLGPESLSFIGSGMAAGVAVAAAALVVAGRRATLAMGTQRPLARSADREDRTGAAGEVEVDSGDAEAEPITIEYPSTLQVSLSTKHFEVTPAIRDHVDEKIKKVLERFGPYILTLDAHLDVLRNPKGKDEKHTAELVAAVRPGYSSKTVRVCVKETSDDMYLAINQVTQQLERKVRQLKEKGQKSVTRRAGLTDAPEGLDLDTSDLDEVPSALG